MNESSLRPYLGKLWKIRRDRPGYNTVIYQGYTMKAGDGYCSNLSGSSSGIQIFASRNLHVRSHCGKCPFSVFPTHEVIWVRKIVGKNGQCADLLFCWIFSVAVSLWDVVWIAAVPIVDGCEIYRDVNRVIVSRLWYYFGTIMCLCMVRLARIFWRINNFCMRNVLEIFFFLMNS